MAGLSRAKAASIQILRTSELKASECKRPNIVQFHVRFASSHVAAPRVPATRQGNLAVGISALTNAALCALLGHRGEALFQIKTQLLSLARARFADAKDQVPLAAPHHQDAEGLQNHFQGLLSEDLLWLGWCTLCNRCYLAID